MKLSWSHRLFLQVNQWVGSSRAYDVVVRFWAEYAIFAMAVGVAGYLLWSNRVTAITVVLVTLPLAWVVGMAIGWLIAWAYPHPRPVVELPQTRQIIVPLSTWKSLPSDHAFSAWLLVWGAVMGSAPGAAWWPLLGFGLSATGISAARVLAGVHYPRDIIWGFILAGVVALAFFG